MIFYIKMNLTLDNKVEYKFSFMGKELHRRDLK